MTEKTVHQQVADQIGDVSPKVKEKVVAVMAERQVEKRSIAIVKVLDKLEDLKKDLRIKVKPDQIQMNEAGDILSSSFSPGKVKEIEEVKQKIAKHEKAIEKAWAGDMNDVYNLAKD